MMEGLGSGHDPNIKGLSPTFVMQSQPNTVAGLDICLHYNQIRIDESLFHYTGLNSEKKLLLIVIFVLQRLVNKQDHFFFFRITFKLEGEVFSYLVLQIYFLEIIIHP